MELIVGESYLGTQPPEVIDISENEKYEFEGKTIAFTVLEKPLRVISDFGDGVSEEIDLPDHLKGKEWSWVENLKTRRKHWFNKKAFEVVLITN